MDQHERVCETLCNRAGFTKCWDADGLTAKYERIRASGKMSSSEALLLDVALDVWNGHGNAPLGRVINVLDNDNLRMVASLLCAIADDGIDGTEVKLWLRRYEAASKPLLRRDEWNAQVTEPARPAPADTKAPRITRTILHSWTKLAHGYACAHCGALGGGSAASEPCPGPEVANA